MAISLPFPVRVAAGLVATGWDTVRNLPGGLPALSVNVAGHAVRLSMRVQQEITQLAARGDELLAGITSRPSEHPAWAHFDEEDAEPAAIVDAGDAEPAAVVARFDQAEFIETELVETELVDLTESPLTETPFTETEPTELTETAYSETELDTVHDGEDVADARPDDGGSGGTEQLPGNPDDDVPPRLTIVRDDPRSGAAHDTASTNTIAGDTDSNHAASTIHPAPNHTASNSDTYTGSGSAAQGTVGVAGGTGADAGPSALPGYDRMTLAQVRGRLRGLSTDDVAGLLAHEQAGASRAPFLTLLTNRISTLEHEAQ